MASKHHLMISHKHKHNKDMIISVLDHEYPHELIRCHRPPADFIKFNSCFRIAASCDGLLFVEFLATKRTLAYAIWNPTIREVRHLPKSRISNLGLRTCGDIVGFGLYKNAYKLLLVTQVHSETYKYIKPAEFRSNITAVNRPCFAEVYSTSSNTWRVILEVPRFWLLSSTSGSVMNESMHWLAKDRKDASGEWSMVSFNMGDEQFHESPLPVFKNIYGSHVLGLLSVMEKKLVVLFTRISTETVDVWVMNEYGVMGSFTRKITIDQITYDRISSTGKYVGLYHDDKIFLQGDEKKVDIYDCKINKTTIVPLGDYTSRDICLYQESQVSVGGAKYNVDSVPNISEIQQIFKEVNYRSLFDRIVGKTRHL